MLLQRQKARQLEQKVCLGLELVPTFLREPAFFLFLHRHHQALLEIATRIWFFGLLHLFQRLSPRAGSRKLPSLPLPHSEQQRGPLPHCVLRHQS